MFETTATILISLLRFAAAFLAIYVLMPRLLFPQSRQRGLMDTFFVNFSLMVCFNIVLGYLLVLLRIYEGLALLLVYLAIPVSRYVIGNINRIAGWCLDAVDGCAKSLGTLASLWRRSQTVDSLRGIVFSHGGVLEMALLVAVLALAAYIRYLDVLRFAVPSMSDSYVTLAWTKYIELRELFHDGIYPQGYYIYLSTLHKFAAENSLYILKYAGPLHGVLIALAAYYTVSRLTGKRLPGIIAAFVYGVLGPYLPMEFARQAASNSQEFALVFLLPSLVFGLRYLGSGSRHDLAVFAATAAAVGLVHALVALFMACGLLAAVAATALTRHTSLRRVAALGGVVALAGLFWVLPAALGLIMGKAFHAASASFAAASVQPGQIEAPPIPLLAWPALAGATLSAIYAPIFVRERERKAGALFALFLVAGAMALHQAPRFGLQNEALAVRSGEFLAVVIPVGVGLLWHALTAPLPSWRAVGWLAPVAAAAALVVALNHFPLKPAEPNRMQWDQEVRQYLRINREYLPFTWLIVSQEEGYALALGYGYHLMTGDFLGYNPASGHHLIFIPGERARGPKEGRPAQERIHLRLPPEKALRPHRGQEQPGPTPPLPRGAEAGRLAQGLPAAPFPPATG